MEKQKPVLFYFHQHYQHNPQINMPVFRNLLERADNVFMEGVSDNLEEIEEMEENWNDCIRRGSLERNRFETGYTHNLIVLRWMLGTDKRIKLERSKESSFDFYEKIWDMETAFLYANLQNASESQEKLLRRLVEYQEKRETGVCDQICQLNGTTLVIFGAAHKKLAELVSERSAVEIHYPFRNYLNNMFKIQLMDSIRNGGRYNEEIALRSLGEGLTLCAIKTNYKRWTSNEECILAHHYAKNFSIGQIFEFRERYLYEADAIENHLKKLRGDRIEIRHDLRIVPPYFKAFKQICGKYRIPLPENLPRRILQGAT